MRNHREKLGPGHERDVAVILLDNHRSHDLSKPAVSTSSSAVSERRTLLQVAADNRIIPVMLPPHTTSILQPCDVRFNGAFKAHLQNQQRLRAVRLSQQPISFRRPTVLTEAVESISKAAQPSMIESAFRESGLVPWNPQIVLEKRSPRRQYTAAASDLDKAGEKGVDNLDEEESEEREEPDPEPSGGQLVTAMPQTPASAPLPSPSRKRMTTTPGACIDGHLVREFQTQQLNLEQEKRSRGLAKSANAPAQSAVSVAETSPSSGSFWNVVTKVGAAIAGGATALVGATGWGGFVGTPLGGGAATVVKKRLATSVLRDRNNNTDQTATSAAPMTGKRVCRSYSPILSVPPASPVGESTERVAAPNAGGGPGRGISSPRPSRTPRKQPQPAISPEPHAGYLCNSV